MQVVVLTVNVARPHSLMRANLSGVCFLRMATESYTSRLLSRAWAMTLSDLGLGGVRPNFVKALIVLSTLLVLYAFGWDERLSDKVGDIWATVLAFTLVFFIVHIWNVLSVPSILQRESDAAIAELQKKLDDKEARQAAIDVLWELRSDGIRLRNTKLLNDQDLHVWDIGVTLWREDVLTQAGIVNPNLRKFLDRLDTTHPPPNNIKFINSHHELRVRITSEILSRLGRYLIKDLYK